MPVLSGPISLVSLTFLAVSTAIRILLYSMATKSADLQPSCSRQRLPDWCSIWPLSYGLIPLALYYQGGNYLYKNRLNRIP